MNELYTFYKDVLGKLDFSITSYIFVEDKIDKFFNELCESPVFIGRTHIDFISYAFAKLEDPIDFTIKNLTTKNIFFNSFNERSLELFLMHDYYNFKHYLSELDKTENRFYTAEIIAKLFINGTAFRVLCNDRNHTSVKYDQHIDTISIQIPFHFIFKNRGSENFRQIQSKLFSNYEDKISDIDLSTLSIHKHGNIYKHSESDNKELLSEELLNPERIKSLSEILFSKLSLLNSSNQNFFFGAIDPDTDKENVLKDFVRLVISQGFSSFLFGCWIENIPSIVNVDAVYGYKQSLGSIVVGYKEKELSYDERTYFKLISDRISHILAAEALFELSSELKYRRSRKIQVSILKEFKDEVISKYGIDHANTEITKDSMSLMEKFLKKVERRKLDNCGLLYFEKYVRDTFQEGKKIDCGLYTEFHSQSEATKCCNLVYEKANDNTMQISVGESTEDNSSNRPIVNLVFPHHLIKILQETKNNTGKDCYVENIETRTNENKLNIILKFNREISIESFCQSLTGEREQGEGDLGQFLRDNYDAIRTIGNLILCEIEEIEGEEKFIPILNFEENVVAKYSTNGTIEKLSLKIQPPDKSLEKIVYQLQYKSI